MKVCAFTPFDLLFVCSPSVFPSTALILALSISRKPGNIIVPGIWKKCLQTNPGSLLSLSFLSISIHSQWGTLQCHPTGTRCIKPWNLKTASFFLTKNSLLPHNNPGNFFHNQMLINDGILVLVSFIQEQTAPLNSPLPFCPSKHGGSVRTVPTCHLGTAQLVCKFVHVK